MDLGKIIYTRLSTVPGVVAIAGDRIYPEVIPQETDRPAIAYDFTLNNPVNGTAPVIDGTVLIGCWAKTNDAAHQLANAANAAMQDYSGQSGSLLAKWFDNGGQTETFDFEYAVWGVVLTFNCVVVGQ